MNGWLADALGLDIRVTTDLYGGGPDALAGLALRRNPRRAHLLVSRVLGKHLPVDPRAALAAGRRLADLVPPTGEAPVVLGYCETATSLGHAVADGLAGSDYLHSTRRAVAGVTPLLAFDEAHSHAARHWVLPADPDLLRAGRPVVLVDDELSTGRTVLATVRALHAHAPHPSYTVATLLDLRPAADRAAFDSLAAELGVRIDAVALLSGELLLPPDIQERAQAVLAAAPAPVPASAPPTRHAVTAVAADWPADLPDGGRHGWTAKDSDRLAEVLPALADRVPTAASTLVLGTEELMYVPLRLAALLADRAGTVAYHSTTRSPVHPVDVEGYAVRSALSFDAPDEPGRPAPGRVYNVRPGAYDRIVVVVDGGAPGPLAAALAACAPVTVVTVPSYRPPAAG